MRSVTVYIAGAVAGVLAGCGPEPCHQRVSYCNRCHGQVRTWMKVPGDAPLSPSIVGFVFGGGPGSVERLELDDPGVEVGGSTFLYPKYVGLYNTIETKHVVRLFYETNRKTSKEKVQVAALFGPNPEETIASGKFVSGPNGGATFLLRAGWILFTNGEGSPGGNPGKTRTAGLIERVNFEDQAATNAHTADPWEPVHTSAVAVMADGTAGLVQVDGKLSRVFLYRSHQNSKVTVKVNGLRDGVEISTAGTMIEVNEDAPPPTPPTPDKPSPGSPGKVLLDRVDALNPTSFLRP